MTIHIFCTPNNRDKTIKKIKNLKFFSTIIKTQTKDMILLKTKNPLYNNDNKMILKITKVLRNIDTIRSISLYPLKTKNKTTKIPKNRHPRKGKLKYLFFDIDSTLTHTGVASLNKNVKDIFEKFMAQNCTIIFCTGRSLMDVKKLIKQYHTSPYGIAENGGMIVNSSSIVNEKFGDRTNSDKLIKYLSNKGIKYKIDKNQQSRRTENILLRNSITKSSLLKHTKNSKLEVEIHTSKNTYHISKKGINKGTAISYLTSPDELDLGKEHETIAMGDSGLDIPMFEFCDISYAVSNADKSVKTKADYILDTEAPNSIEELYDKLFAYA